MSYPACAPIRMRAMGDCAVCCLAMLLGLEYTTVWDATPKRGRAKLATEGLSVTQIINVARKFAVKLEYHDEADEEDIGMLYLTTKGEPKAHVAMWLHGVIYDPGPDEIWTDDTAYYSSKGYTFEGFIKRGRG